MSRNQQYEKGVSAKLSWKQIFGKIVSFDSGRLPFLFALMVIATLVEGLGIFLLFPLAAIILQESSSENLFLSFFDQLFANWGLETTDQKLIWFAVIFLLLIVVRGVILIWRDIALTRHKNSFITAQRLSLYELLTQTSWPAIAGVRKSAIIHTLTTDLSRIGTLVHFFFNGLIQIIQIAVLLIIAMTISPQLSLLVVLLGAFMVLAGFLWVRQSHRLGEAETEINQDLFFESDIFLAGLKTAQIYGAEDAFLQRFSTSVHKINDVDLKFVIQQGRLKRMLEVIVTLFILAIFLIGHLKLSISATALLAVGAIMLRVAPQMIALVQGIQLVSNAAPALASAEKLKSELAHNASPTIKTEPQGSLQTSPITGPISFLDCKVTAEESDKILLEIDDLVLPEHGLVIVTGPSGAGKSVFVEMICGLRTLNAGQVKIGSMRRTADNFRIWRDNLSFMPQEPFLFHGTVRENVIWPHDSNSITIDDGKLWAGLRAANLESTVRDLPLGLDEPIKNGGSRLSGGERQRLCLTRCLLRPAQIYIFDEPTANLDPETEKIIVSNLKQLTDRALVVLISHNPILEAQADLLLKIESGKVRITQ